MNKAARSLCIAGLLLICTLQATAQTPHSNQDKSKPNIIFVVADDMGRLDTGYSGNPIAITPNLDQMAATGLHFENFYSAHATCSPGRMAILTGRTPLRARMVTTVGPMQPGEITVAQALKTAGYETAHFGKWGLGREGTHPMKVGFDKASWSKGYFENGVSFFEGDSDKRDERPVKTTGESSIATMKLAIEFIKPRAERDQPFFVQVCFGSPHAPHVAAEEFKKLYPDLPENQKDFWGEVSGLDAAVGLLRRELRNMKIADNTLLWFVSDNGSIRKSERIDKKGQIGARTVGLLEWPGKITKPMHTEMPVCHTDMYPTVLDIVGVTMEHQPVVDGISLLPLFEGKMDQRPKPLGFTSGRYAVKGDPSKCLLLSGVWIDGRYMLRLNPATKKRAESIALYDIQNDPLQENDLADAHPDIVKRMLEAMEDWRKGVQQSFAGNDYRQ